MAGSRMPDSFFAERETLMPEEEPIVPEGKGPRALHRAVIRMSSSKIEDTTASRPAMPRLHRASNRSSHVAKRITAAVLGGFDGWLGLRAIRSEDSVESAFDTTV